jgi:hypothetical protein
MDRIQRRIFDRAERFCRPLAAQGQQAGKVLIDI